MAFRRIKNLYHTPHKGILDLPVLVPPYRVDVKTSSSRTTLAPFSVKPMQLQSSEIGAVSLSSKSNLAIPRNDTETNNLTSVQYLYRPQGQALGKSHR